MFDSGALLNALGAAANLSIPVAFAYAAYWGLVIRKGFVMHLYRNQALGVAAIAAYFAVNNVFSLFISVGPGSSYGLILLVALEMLAGIVPIFIWIDTTARIARRSDPIERDSLHWTSVRYVVIAAVVLSTAIDLVYAPILLTSVGNYVPSIPLVFNVLALVPFFGVLVPGVLLLPVSAVRSRDKNLRRHIVWFAAFFVTLLAAVASALVFSLLSPAIVSSNLSAIDILLVTLLFVVPFDLGAYCLYRSARSLAPFTRHLEDGEAAAER